ncbi:LysR family transcriptional regulator [Alicyclobacillus curvatus]|nr:LysR family transcriptional regulator [Alicyclobacillus curvatus]
MELRQLEYFMAVCEELHFTRAAEKMGVSAPNISQQIGGLENEIGVPLFDRIGRRIALTEAGTILREHCDAIFSHLRHANDAILDLKKGRGGRLSIGVLPGDADLMFDALLLNFHRTYPEISLSLLETTRVTEQVLDGSIDVGVTIMPIFDDRLVQIPLFHEEFALAVSIHDSLVKEDSIPLGKLQRLKLVMFPSDHQCRKLIDQFCVERGFRLQPYMETTTLSSLLNMVQSEIGAAILPRLLLDSLDKNVIKGIRLVQPTPSQDICLIYRSDRYLGYAARTFIKTLKAYIETAIHGAVSAL